MPAPTDIVLSTASVSENQPIGTTIGTFTVVTSGAAILAYILVAGDGDQDNGSFSVSSNVLKTFATFNYEAKSSYGIRVKVIDADGLYFEKQFTISILDVVEPSQDYTQPYHTYPVFSARDGFEGAMKIYETFPTPQDLIDYGLKGLPKRYPLTGEPITVKDVERYLTSAVSEVQMDLGCDVFPTEHYQSHDFIDGMFSANFTGLKLARWPAWKVLSVKMKFAHTQTSTPFQSYTMPAAWVALRRNRITIAPSYGGMIVQQTADASAAGIFQYITGFARGAYHPAMIETQYVAGFDHDMFPAILKDLILTIASIRMLTDLGPKLFPYQSASVSLDGISQSASLPGPAYLLQMIEALKLKRAELTASFTKYFGRTIKMSFLGA